MPADPQIVRQWLLLKTLAARHYGVAVRELAEELDVAEKTIRRDIDTLRGVGFRLEETVGERGRKVWKLPAGTSQPPLCFAFDELLAIYLGRRFLDPLEDTLIGQAADRALAKIRSMVGERALAYLERMAANIHLTAVGAGDYRGKGEVLDQVQQGIEESKATMIVYRSQRSTEPVTYEIFPYALIEHRGSVYVVAHSRDHDAVRQFKLDRIQSAEVTEFPFHRPDAFNVADYMRGSFGVYHGDGGPDVKVRVRFRPSVARYVSESRWHVSQQLTPQPDASLVAEFRLSSTEEIRHWILSFGRQAVVLEPVSLRDEIAAELREMVRSYDTALMDGAGVPDPAADRPSAPDSQPVGNSRSRPR
ncbi:MAG TPA: transcriptional regulator [Pirellulales bacterium]|nr:transcriptional regulator [Pirellulales bacterium]